MSDHEHDNPSDSEQPVHSDESTPSEPHNDTAEDLTDTSGEHQDPVSNTASEPDPITPSDFVSDLGDDEPEDFPGDDEKTREQIGADSLAEAGLPEQPHSEVTITISGAEVSTDFEGAPSVESVTSVGEMSNDDLQRLRRVLSEEASRRGVAARRPFKDMDIDSLQVLYNQVRSEMGQR